MSGLLKAIVDAGGGKILATLGGITVPGALSTAYIKSVDSEAEGLKEKIHNRYLRLKGLLEGYQPTTPKSGDPLHSFVTGDLSPDQKKLLEDRVVRESIWLKRILNTPGSAHPAIVAHELGHVQQPDFLKSFPMYGLGKMTPGLAAAYLGLAGKLTPAKMKAALALGMIPAAGTLTAELDASRRGFKELRKLGYGKLDSTKSFMGVPTYAAMASVPLVTLLLRRKLFKV